MKKPNKAQRAWMKKYQKLTGFECSGQHLDFNGMVALSLRLFWQHSEEVAGQLSRGVPYIKEKP